MTSPFTKFAVAGATGSRGAPVVKQLFAAGFTVTARSRNASPILPSNVKVAQVDCGSVHSLRNALSGQDAVVSTLGSAALSSQITLIDAAIAAGVQRIIPSEFGCDTDYPYNNTLPAYKVKVDVRNHLQKVSQGTQTSYTFVNNNAFLDWGLETGFILDVKNESADLFDGGNTVFTVTPLDVVGQGVLGVLRNPDQTKNRGVRIHGAGVTMEQLLGMAQKHAGAGAAEWKIRTVNGEEVEDQAYRALNEDPTNFMAWAIPMIRRAAFGKDVGNNFSEINDNALLGVQAFGESEVEDIVKARCSLI
ncbi:hypothetical protein BAUCODRAFT_171177 [Baudoinia panamericana UAMH 10762]|uniref:NmrA-like domain-containing protein n=1 Tax=Baudoinia panamericana (strain UAMH 10762) TaxID=717646 RepID=M2M0F4_BAUPA|nr:uncharacterized protein BAUCODRAFT_171177 [Baudoinia panamericana UAMH 10762]EMD00483.1 hypothetical protein BAUCODRAFT_171177 [Baudoinia panamericana UAMH 10762]